MDHSPYQFNPQNQPSAPTAPPNQYAGPSTSNQVPPPYQTAQPATNHEAEYIAMIREQAATEERQKITAQYNEEWKRQEAIHLQRLAEAERAAATLQLQVQNQTGGRQPTREASMASIPEEPSTSRRRPTKVPARTTRRGRSRSASPTGPPNKPAASHRRGWSPPRRARASNSRRTKSSRTSAQKKARDEDDGDSTAETEEPDDLDDEDSPRQEFQLRRKDLPEDIQGFKDALMLHIRIIWRLLSAKKIPTAPSPEAITKFKERFTSSTAVESQRHSNTLLIAISKVRGASMTAKSPDRKSKIVRSASRIEEHILQYIDNRIARYGLEEWAVDFDQSPYSLYNSAHRIIALDTFRQAVGSHAYASLKPNLEYTEDMNLMTRLYDHIVHYYFYKRFSRERDNPGSVNAADDLNPGYRNRARLAEARYTWLKENGFPPRYLALISPKSTSDDERDPEGKRHKGNPIFYIKKRPERSQNVTRFFRILDQKREKQARFDPTRRWKERVRREPALGEPEETAFPSIPLNMPFDYFDPAFFNDLPPKLRAKAATSQAALLPDVELSFTRCAEERYSDAEFNAEFADARLAQYDMIDDGDLEFPPEDDGDEDMAGDDEEHEDGYGADADGDAHIADA